jgi:hypothetical protein
MKKYHPMFIIVIPNPERHQEKKNRLSKTEASSMKLKRPPQDSVARKPSPKDQILRKKQKTESTVLSSRKDKKPKSKKHKRKNTDQKRKREARGNTKTIQNGRGIDLRTRNKDVPQKENQKTPPGVRRKFQKSKNLRLQNKIPYVLQKPESCHPRSQNQNR